MFENEIDKLVIEANSNSKYRIENPDLPPLTMASNLVEELIDNEMKNIAEENIFCFVEELFNRITSDYTAQFLLTKLDNIVKNKYPQYKNELEKLMIKYQILNYKRFCLQGDTFLDCITRLKEQSPQNSDFIDNLVLLK